MAKKKNQETQEEQSERFRAAVRQMIDDGELNPIEADKTLDAMLRQQRHASTKSI
jgi:polyhydroxyalkanoate synthesis regulator phasin